MLESADGPEGVASTIDRWAADVVGTDDRFAGWHYRTGLQSALAGQLMVRAVELSTLALDDDEEGERHRRALVHLRNDETAFLGVPFDEAIEFFRSKEVLTPEEFDDLRDRFRAGGFTARAIASGAMRERARSAILRALEDGTTVAQAIQEIRADSLTLGITPADTSALQTIVRTNVSSAYGHGRWQAMNDPAVLAARPYGQVVTAADYRVRDTHRGLHGLVYEQGTELAATLACPLGFQCRCSNLTLSPRQLERMGGQVATRLPAGAGPDVGWEGPPAPLADAAE